MKNALDIFIDWLDVICELEYMWMEIFQTETDIKQEKKNIRILTIMKQLLKIYI